MLLKLAHNYLRHGLHLVIGAALGAALTSQERLAVLVHVKLGDEHLGRVDADVDGRACEVEGKASERTRLGQSRDSFERHETGESMRSSRARYVSLRHPYASRVIHRPPSSRSSAARARALDGSPNPLGLSSPVAKIHRPPVSIASRTYR